jgi:Asp-tRNA(Asn)/Glu-tRNA(Gln) amidotransferase A subunit family amidase
MDMEIARGHYRGPLHGIPIALKDLVDTEGVATTYGSESFRDRVPSADATLVTRLKAAGCINLGKLTMSELAMVGPPGFGKETLNPWNTSHAPGGSSSGSATAVAAGLCAGSIGSDTGGSIRFPAANNNIVGLMPTYGRVSRKGVMPLSWTLDHVGPMTRTVEDAALMLHAISGFDPADKTTSTRY